MRMLNAPKINKSSKNHFSLSLLETLDFPVELPADFGKYSAKYRFSANITKDFGSRVIISSGF